MRALAATPLRNARRNASSDQRPMPVSGSGVMLACKSYRTASRSARRRRRPGRRAACGSRGNCPRRRARRLSRPVPASGAARVAGSIGAIACSQPARAASESTKARRTTGRFTSIGEASPSLVRIAGTIGADTRAAPPPRPRPMGPQISRNPCAHPESHEKCGRLFARSPYTRRMRMKRTLKLTLSPQPRPLPPSPRRPGRSPPPTSPAPRPARRPPPRSARMPTRAPRHACARSASTPGPTRASTAGAGANAGVDVNGMPGTNVATPVQPNASAPMHDTRAPCNKPTPSTQNPGR